MAGFEVITYGRFWVIAEGYGFLGFIPQNYRPTGEAAYICLDDCGRSRPKIVNRL